MNSSSRTVFPRGLRYVAGLLAFGLALAACASGVKPSADPSGTGSSVPTTGSPGSGSGTGKASGGTTAKSTPKGSVTPASRGSGPSPVALPWTPSPDVPVEATLSPTCFKRGGLVTITVHTQPKAGIAYIAVYSDNGNGAPKPTGSGYGGNDKGLSNDNGDFISAFTVSLDAPSGPGRVDVIVGWNNMWGYDGPTFTVAGPDGRC